MGLACWVLQGRAAWMVIYFRRLERWSMLPVLWLSAVMVLFLDLNALYFFYPRRPNYINMHHEFWGMFVLMVVYALPRKRAPTGGRLRRSELELDEPRFAWERWDGRARWRRWRSWIFLAEATSTMRKR